MAPVLASLLVAGLVAVIASLYPTAYWIYCARGLNVATSSESEVRGFLETHAGEPVAVGFGDDAAYPVSQSRSELRPVPQFLLEASALMDMQQAGFSLPRKTYVAIQSGEVRTWLIPRGSEPFSMRNFYAGQDLFGEEFRSVFRQHYEITGQTRFFDVWSYRANRKL